jgi:UDP-N-acetylmuramate--alanine ligase
MNVYFSGILGKGLSALAFVANDAGMKVFGSDRGDEEVLDEFAERGIEIAVGAQDGKFLQEKAEKDGIDWFVYTSALPADHPELLLAKELGLKISKRDEFLAWFLQEKGLKLVAIAGTDGKSTTTAMTIWTFKELGLPESYIVGTGLPWAVSGKFDPAAKYFIYEADEYDRNFLRFQPEIAMITSIHYDHPEVYATPEDYLQAFEEFRDKSGRVIEDVEIDPRVKLAGEIRRYDATLVLEAVRSLFPDVSEDKIIDALNRFPGLSKRFEKITEGVYSDYAHHPEAVKAVLNIAREVAETERMRGVATVYEPLQNIRQHEVYSAYKDAFLQSDKIFWLPTYLTREERKPLPILKPEFFVELLENKEKAETSELNDELFEKVRKLRDDGFLILIIAGGHSDIWFKEKFSS